MESDGAPDQMAINATQQVREVTSGYIPVLSPLPPPVCSVIRARICKRLRSPRIDSKESIQPAFVAWRAGTSNTIVVPARQAGNRFQGSLKGSQRAVYKRAVPWTQI